MSEEEEDSNADIMQAGKVNHMVRIEVEQILARLERYCLVICIVRRWIRSERMVIYAVDFAWVQSTLHLIQVSVLANNIICIYEHLLSGETLSENPDGVAAWQSLVWKEHIYQLRGKWIRVRIVDTAKLVAYVICVDL